MGRRPGQQLRMGRRSRPLRGATVPSPCFPCRHLHCRESSCALAQVMQMLRLQPADTVDTENSVNSPGVEHSVPRNPLSMVFMGSLWKLKGMRKSEYNGRLCRVVSVRGTVAKVALVGGDLGQKFRVNCSRLIRPNDFDAVITETDEQVYERILVQKKFDQLGRIY